MHGDRVVQTRRDPPPGTSWVTMAGMRVFAAVLFVLLVGEAALLSPAGEGFPDWVIAASSGDWAAHDPLVIAHFMLMGVWPLLLVTQTADRWRTRPVPLLPFALLTFAGGAFALLPGLVLVGDARHPPGRIGRLSRHPIVQGLLAAQVLGLLGWGLTRGSVAAWWTAFTTDPFLHIMAFDSVAVWLTSIALARTTDDGVPWTRTLLPAVGTAWYNAAPRAGQIEATAPS